MTMLEGRVVGVRVGTSSNDYALIENVKFIRWREAGPGATPRLLPSSKNPAGWLQGHSWIEGEIGLQTHDTTLDGYAPGTSDATVVPYFVVEAKTVEKTNHYFPFTGLIIEGRELSIEKDEPVTVYKFKAYSVGPSVN